MKPVRPTIALEVQRPNLHRALAMDVVILRLAKNGNAKSRENSRCGRRRRFFFLPPFFRAPQSEFMCKAPFDQPPGMGNPFVLMKQITSIWWFSLVIWRFGIGLSPISQRKKTHVPCFFLGWMFLAIGFRVRGWCSICPLQLRFKGPTTNPNHQLG